jgi:hypothetical protein
LGNVAGRPAIATGAPHSTGIHGEGAARLADYPGAPSPAGFAAAGAGDPVSGRLARGTMVPAAAGVRETVT